MSLANFGKCSLIRMPGTAVSIGLNSPRMFAGASGLGRMCRCGWARRPSIAGCTIWAVALPGREPPAAPASRTASRPRRSRPGTPAGRGSGSSQVSAGSSGIQWFSENSLVNISAQASSRARFDGTGTGSRGRGTASVRRRWAGATGPSGNRSPATSSADRPAVPDASPAGMFRPANCSEFICRSRCGMPAGTRRVGVPVVGKELRRTRPGGPAGVPPGLPRRRAEDRHQRIVQLPSGEGLDRHPAEQRGLLSGASPGRLVRW
jgi:hypothetical protein